MPTVLYTSPLSEELPLPSPFTGLAIYPPGVPVRVLIGSSPFMPIPSRAEASAEIGTPVTVLVPAWLGRIRAVWIEKLLPETSAATCGAPA